MSYREISTKYLRQVILSILYIYIPLYDACRGYILYIESIYRNVAPRFGRCARCSALAAGVRTDYKAKRRKEKEATERER